MSNIRLCFLQVTSPEIKNYSKYSVEINKKYCELHGYDYLELSAIRLNEYAPMWSKIFHSIDTLKTGKYTHVFYLDADAVVINKNKRLEEVIEKLTASIGFSENDWNGGDLVNTGSFICTTAAIEILEDCVRICEEEMQEKKFGRWHEQSIISEMYNNGVKMDLFPMNEINSYWKYDIESNDDQFIYHFMSRPLEEKIEIAKKLFEIYVPLEPDPINRCDKA